MRIGAESSKLEAGKQKNRFPSAVQLMVGAHGWHLAHMQIWLALIRLGGLKAEKEERRERR